MRCCPAFTRAIISTATRALSDSAAAGGAGAASAVSLRSMLRRSSARTRSSSAGPSGRAKSA